MVSPIEVSHYFIKKGVEDNDPVSLLWLVKACYIAHGCHIGCGEKRWCVMDVNNKITIE